PRSAHRRRARPRAGPRRGLPEPHPPRLPSPGPLEEGSLQGGRPRAAPLPHGHRPPGVRRSGRAHPGRPARRARRHSRGRAGAARRGDAHDRGGPGRSGRRTRKRVDRASLSGAGRHGMGRPPARRALRARARVRHVVRGARRRDRGEVRDGLRPAAGALLDCREGRADRGLDLPCQEIEDGGEAAPPPPRAGGPRRRPGGATRGRMRPLRARGRLSPDHALDTEPPRRRAPPLREGRLPARGTKASPELRAGSRGRDLGSRSVTIQAVELPLTHRTAPVGEWQWTLPRRTLVYLQEPSRRGLMKLAVSLLACCTLAAAGYAQQGPPMPKPGPEHAVLKQDVGTWDATVEMVEPGKPTPTVSKGTETTSMV